MLIIPWKMFTGQMLWMMLIVSKHLHLEGTGADVVYELSVDNDSNLKTKSKLST